MHVSCRESFCHLNHLFKLSKMINWQLHHWLLEDIVSAGLHVNILPISRLFLFSICWMKSWIAQRKLSSKLRSCVAGPGTVALTGSGKCSQSTSSQAVLWWPWSTFSNSTKESDQLRLHFSAPLLNSGIVLLMVNSIPYFPLSLWISTQLLFCRLLLWSL
jgi:hypothetical protein